MADADIASARRVLVVGPSWLGDAVMAQCLYMALDRVPGTVIDVVSPSLFEPLLAMMPQVNESIRSPFRRGKLDLAARFSLGRRLAAREYDQAIVLPNSWKSALPAWIAGVPRRTGYVGEQRWGVINDARRLDKSALPMTAQRFAALAVDAGAPAPDPRRMRPALTLSPGAPASTATAMGLPETPERILAMCPGAEYGPSKQWPATSFAELAAAMRERGWQVWLLGSANDAEVAGEINRRCGDQCHDLSGRTSIEQVIHLMSLATAVVSNDSGLMHVAAALGRPLVAVFGSTDPGHTPPLSDNHRLEYLNLACSPCFKRQCPLGHLNCLEGISPEDVLADLEALCAS